MPRVGFWAEKREEATREHPWPKAQCRKYLPTYSIIQRGCFLEDIRKKERISKKTYYPPHPENTGNQAEWDWCRLCGKWNVGCFDHELNEWTWPDSYTHYVQEHYIEIDPTFAKFVLDEP